MKKYLVIFFFFLFGRSAAQANDAELINSLLGNIAAAQVPENGEFYAGSFNAYRECAGWPHNYRPDNNVFFTALTVFSLRNMIPWLGETDKRTAAGIIENAQRVFPHYQDRQGYPYYSFWPAGKGILPHSLFVNRIRLIDMGQDADDAVMSLMATDATDSTCTVLKKRMMQVSNLEKKKTNSTYRRYREIAAYSTWLGFGMKPDFDLGVHCNILYFMFDRKLPLVKQDSATIELLEQVIKNREYVKAPVYISPYYARRPVLMYHLARLMGRFHIAELEPYRAQLVKDMQKELDHSGALMDRLILSTSLLRLGAKPPPVDIPDIIAFEKSGQQNFVFFQARAAFSYPTPFKQVLLHWSYMRYSFFCPVYNKVLWLEYLVERNKK